VTWGLVFGLLVYLALSWSQLRRRGDAAVGHGGSGLVVLLLVPGMLIVMLLGFIYAVVAGRRTS
jgi:hypothetical protein